MYFHYIFWYLTYNVTYTVSTIISNMMWKLLLKFQSIVKILIIITITLLYCKSLLSLNIIIKYNMLKRKFNVCENKNNFIKKLF